MTRELRDPTLDNAPLCYKHLPQEHDEWKMAQPSESEGPDPNATHSVVLGKLLFLLRL